MDTPLTLSHTVNMVGLIQTTAHWLLTRHPFRHWERDYLLYRLNRFRACRFGIAGAVTNINTGDSCRLSEDTLRLLKNIAASTDKVGATDAIEAIHPQVKDGHGEAQNMRDFVAEGGSLSGLIKKHYEIWTGL